MLILDFARNVLFDDPEERGERCFETLAQRNIKICDPKTWKELHSWEFKGLGHDYNDPDVCLKQFKRKGFIPCNELPALQQQKTSNAKEEESSTTTKDLSSANESNNTKLDINNLNETNNTESINSTNAESTNVKLNISITKNMSNSIKINNTQSGINITINADASLSVNNKSTSQNINELDAAQSEPVKLEDESIGQKTDLNNFTLDQNINNIIQPMMSFNSSNCLKLNMKLCDQNGNPVVSKEDLNNCDSKICITPSSWEIKLPLPISWPINSSDYQKICEQQFNEKGFELCEESNLAGNNGKMLPSGEEDYEL